MEQNYKIETCKHELDYRIELFNADWGKILDLETKCTVCASNLNWMILFKKQIVKHPVLETLLCEACLEPHKTQDWNEACLWCGVRKNDEIIPCCYCPFQFCESCIKLNFGTRGVVVARLSDWKCYMCKKERLYALRAVCDAADKFIAELKKTEECAPKNSKSCSFCLNPFKSIAETKCGHKFHKDCFENWVTKSKNCPLCRAIIKR